MANQKLLEVSKIVREDEITKRSEMIYQSKAAEERELAGIAKMFVSANAVPDEKLVKACNTDCNCLLVCRQYLC